MKKLLIIKSVSVQQLDKNFQVIRDKYKDYRIHVLTHEHNKNLLETYKEVDRVFAYPYKSSFSIFRRVKEMKTEVYDEIIIPVANVSGAGFLNVLLFSLTLNGKRRKVCNLVSDIWPVSTWNIFWRVCKNVFFLMVSFVCAAVMCAFMVWGLPLMLKWMKSKD